MTVQLQKAEIASGSDAERAAQLRAEYGNGRLPSDAECIAEANASRPIVIYDKPGIGYRAAKRAFDIASSTCGLVVLSPLLLGTALAVKVTSPGPAIFRQRRFGKDKAPFDCYKFRSMKIDTPVSIPTAEMLENPEFMTPIGAFLRRTSLDELPQLVNVLRGDMSVVGPRPMILAEYAQVVERDRTGANDVRPGITGLAQVSGRDTVGLREKADLDGRYRRTMSVAGDVAILLKTVSVVATKSGYGHPAQDSKGAGGARTACPADTEKVS